MKRLHSFSALCALALALLVPAAADAQQQGTVYLNDGSVLSGQVIEFVPGDHITLQIGTTPPIVIPQANIARVEMGQAAAPPQPFAPQPTQPYQPPQQQQAGGGSVAAAGPGSPRTVMTRAAHRAQAQTHAQTQPQAQAQAHAQREPR